MKSFITECAETLAENHSNTSEYVIIIPSKRAKKYMLEALSIAYAAPVNAPSILTIEEFVTSRNTDAVIDKTRQLFLLFKIFKQEPNYSDLSFEEFLTWGPMLVNDFEEMNRYLLDSNQVFKNLIAIKELESWNLGPEQELSQSQRKFMEFWDELPPIFNEFNTFLEQEHKTTSGKALRQLALHGGAHISNEKKYYFIGFNALTLGELTIIKTLRKNNQAEYWVDVDRYYLENTSHEAGAFIRKNLAFLDIKKPEFLKENLLNRPVDVQLISCPQATGQVKIAATELSKLNEAELNQTLVLLADESLVVPLMKNLPSSIPLANLTIGLPLKQTALKTLIDTLFSIQENKIRFKTKSAYFKDLLSFYQHPLINSWLDAEVRKDLLNWELNTIKMNRVFQDPTKLTFNHDIDELTQLAFSSWNADYTAGIKLIQQLTFVLLSKFNQAFEFEKQQLIMFQEAIVTLEVLAKEGLPPMNLKTFRMIFNQHWTKKSIAFHGNPTSGLQIMGLLETRMLDFKRVIILGMNEGMLPPTNPIDSIIPMDLRRALGLPTMREKQGLFAHHFYRLLHTAEHLVITYSTANEALGSAEPSRYIAQLEMELSRANKKFQIAHKYYTTTFPEQQAFDSAVVLKRPQINHLLDRYFSKHISASALAKYLACPLDFYYRYLAEFGEEESVEEELEMSSLGRFIHNTLEILYSPHAELDQLGNEVLPKPDPIAIHHIEDMLVKAPALLTQQFLDYLDNEQKLIESGKNWLTLNVAQELIKNLLLNDIEYLKTQAEDVYIHRIEARLTASMDLIINGREKQVNWIGFVDRIDRIGNSYRLVDYKSGLVKSEHVVYKRKSELVQSFKSCKHALQLATYAFLFNENYNHPPAVMGIYAIQRKTQAFFPLVHEGITPEEFMRDFKDLIQEVFSEIYDDTVPFSHQADAKYCNYC
mgnify:FL=1